MENKNKKKRLLLFLLYIHTLYSKSEHSKHSRQWPLLYKVKESNDSKKKEKKIYLQMQHQQPYRQNPFQ